MKLREFLDIVPKNGWIRTKEGKIRREIDGQIQCPLSSLINESEFGLNLYKVDMSERLRFKIIDAADWVKTKEAGVLSIRIKLFEKLGIS